MNIELSLYFHNFHTKYIKFCRNKFILTNEFEQNYINCSININISKNLTIILHYNKDYNVSNVVNSNCINE